MRNFKMIIIVMLIFASCSKVDLPKVFPEEEVTDIKLLGDVNHTIKLLEEVYSVKNIDSHKFYYLDNTYHFTVNFNNNVTPVDIKNLRTITDKLFLLQDLPKQYDFPYRKLFLGGKQSIYHREDMPYNNLSIRVYTNHERFYRSDYHFSDSILESEKHWENYNLAKSFDSNKSIMAESFVKSINSDNINVMVEDSVVCKDTLLIKLMYKNEIDYDDVNKIKLNISDDLMPQLRNKALSINEFSSKYKKCVLLIYSGDSIKSVEELSNKKWETIDFTDE